ncbi:hypothetical protein MFIFM68171_00842 [Madurella fahalii]|uniref:Reverse transcriptase n=1 Tax=Madurella fahalii TaxID=1157608 RepID=A0ABQ0FYQ0_9PEZI
MYENGDVEGNALVLTCDQLQLVDEFLNQLPDTTDNADKFEHTRTPLSTDRNKKTDKNAERNEWKRYFGVATSAARVKSKCLTALKAVAKRWCHKVVPRYEWASMGERFLQSASRRCI